MQRDCLIQILRMLVLELPSSDVDLKVAVVKLICAGSSIDVFLDSAAFKQLCEESGQLAFDIMKEYRRQIKEKEEKTRTEKEREKVKKNGHRTAERSARSIRCGHCGHVEIFTDGTPLFYTCSTCGRTIYRADFDLFCGSLALIIVSSIVLCFLKALSTNTNTSSE